MKRLTKKEIIDAVATESGVSKLDVEKVLKAREEVLAKIKMRPQS